MAFYAVLLDSTRKDVVVMKATSGPTLDGNWSSVRSLSNDNAVDSLWAHQDGTDIHIATVEAVTGRIRYTRFSTATDLWVVKRENVVTPTNLTANLSCSLAIRSDGDVIILYTNNDGTNDRVDYARREAAVWTTDIQVDNAGSVNWIAGSVVRGASDRMHFFFKDDTNGGGFQRTLRSDNTLEAFPSSYDPAVSARNHIFGQGVTYVSGGATKVRVPYAEGGANTRIAVFDSADSPTVTHPDGNVGDNNTDVLNETPTHCLAIDAVTLHLVYADSVTNDVFRDENHDDDGWGTDVEELDAVTVNRISCNTYSRSGIKLAYVYDDAGTPKYREVDIGAFPVALTNRRRGVVPGRGGIFAEGTMGAKGLTL